MQLQLQSKSQSYLVIRARKVAHLEERRPSWLGQLGNQRILRCKLDMKKGIRRSEILNQKESKG